MTNKTLFLIVITLLIINLNGNTQEIIKASKTKALFVPSPEYRLIKNQLMDVWDGPILVGHGLVIGVTKAGKGLLKITKLYSGKALAPFQKVLPSKNTKSYVAKKQDLPQPVVPPPAHDPVHDYSKDQKVVFVGFGPPLFPAPKLHFLWFGSEQWAYGASLVLNNLTYEQAIMTGSAFAGVIHYHFGNNVKQKGLAANLEVGMMGGDMDLSDLNPKKTKATYKYSSSYLSIGSSYKYLYQSYVFSGGPFITYIPIGSGVRLKDSSIAVVPFSGINFGLSLLFGYQW